MRKSGNIRDMFKNQRQKTIPCPACGLPVPQTKMNQHLDLDCTSLKGNSFVVDQKATGDPVTSLIEATLTQTKSNDTEAVTTNGNDPIKRETSMESTIVEAKRASQNTLKTKPLLNTSAPWRSNTAKGRYSKTRASAESTISDDDDMFSEELPLNCIDIAAEYDKSSFEQASSDSKAQSYNSDPPAEETGNFSTYLPYYIVNFKHIVDVVLQDEYNQHLFDSVDLSYVGKFHSLSDAAQKLYVRLFQRKYRWLRPSKINYPQIAGDLRPFLAELVQCEFLDSGEANLELEAALDLLSLAESKSLSKHFNFNVLGKNKAEINQLLIDHGKQHKSFFSSCGNNSVSNAILKKVQQIMGPCYRLALEPKRLFTRVLMLFSLPTIAEDDEEAAGGQQQQLFTLLQVNKGEVTFPKYSITRECVIFENRDDLIRYEVARQLENDILNAIESKNFELGKKLYLQAEKELMELNSNGFFERSESIPCHLRRYTAGHVYTRCLNQGVEVLQKLRQYAEAVELLRKLLYQTTYCQDRHGKWWDRIALNLEQHLKQPEEAAKAIKESLKDFNVRVGCRLALLYRAERINGKSEDEELKTYLVEMSSITDAPKVTIRGRLLPRPIPGRRHIFISSNSSDVMSENDITVLSVEQLAIEHYKNEGYTQGVHGEGATFISLYTLLFWDIMYDGSIPDVFISPYQNYPLDLNSDHFYQCRESQITSRLHAIRNSSFEELISMMHSSWLAHYGQSSLVCWDLFADDEQVAGLISCLGSVILAGICERLAKDFRYTRSGVPDLVVWNPDTKVVKIVEVKGPGDKLSPKQILWLDYLLKHGADAEVCLVEAVGSKKLRKK